MVAALAGGLLAFLAIAPARAQSYPAQYAATVWRTEQRLPVNSVPAIAQDHEVYLWVATDGGLARFDGVASSYTERDGMPGKQLIASIREDAAGGLYCFREEKLARRAGSFDALRIAEDRNVGVWLSGEQGLRPLRDCKTVLFGQRHDLPPYLAGTLCQGSNGTICLATGVGLYRLRDGRFKTARNRDGLPSAGLRGFLDDGKGSFWLISKQGIFRVSPFDLHFTPLHPSAPERQRFKYHLKPYGRDWVAAGTRRTAHYANMAPGKCPFRVIAANSFGSWDEQGAGVRFVLRPNIFETPWLYLLVAGAAVLCAAGAYRLRIRQLRGREMQLERLVDIRTQELRAEIAVREEAESALRQAHAELEDRVRERTAELRESELRFRTFVDHAADALFVLDFDQKTLVDVNRAACESLGFTREELIGKTPLLFDVDVGQAGMEAVMQRAAAGETVFDTHWHRRKDGTVFPVEAHTSQVWYGGRHFLLKIARDITDHLRAEEAVRQSEKRLREVIDTIPANVWSATPDGSVDFVNQRCLEYSGHSFEESLGRGWEALFHPEDLGHYLEKIGAGIVSGEAIEAEARMRRADGQYRWMLFRNVPLRDAAGKIVKWYGETTDIDDRKRAEQSLKRSEAYLAESQRLTHTGSWAWDAATGKYNYWSAEMYQILGFNPQEAIPTREAVFRRMLPEDRHRVESNFQKSILEKVDTFDEYRLVLPDRMVKDIHIIRHPVLNGAGELVELVGTAMDITERKRNEEALRRTAAYLADAQRLTHTGAWASGRDTTPLYWSEEVFRIFGFDPQQGLPTREQPLTRVHPEDLDRFLKGFYRTINEKVDFDGEYRVVLPDGTLKHVHAVAHPVVGHNRELVEVVGTVVDVTDRKRAEAERERLRQLEAELAHMHRVSMMGEMSASIAHEVNQPLSGIVSNGSACLRWLAGNPPNLEEAREASRRIVRDGKRAGEVIARIRALTNRAATPREELDVNDTVREVLALIEDQAKRQSVIIRTRLADGILLVSGDRVQLQQVILNLVLNGIEAMSGVEDRPRELVIATRKADAEQVEVTVQDSGTGLEPSTMGRIFDPFYTTKPGGMGLGLSICRSILLGHEGRLWATDNDGAGTSFHFTLPAHHEQGRHHGVAET